MFISSSRVFARGLPEPKKLQNHDVAEVLSAVLRYNYVSNSDDGDISNSNKASSDDDMSSNDDNTSSDINANSNHSSSNPGNYFPSDRIKLCFRRGWLHSDKLSVIGQENRVGYFFPSLLHRWYVEWNLWDTLPKNNFETNGLLDFAIRVISCFSPTRLAATRRLASGGIQQVPEAHYQDEFYMNCHIRSKGSILSFPESGTNKGRVDFYIPAKEWGVELVRDGNKLAQHCGRFSPDGPYMTDLALSDYIILDCRQTHPQVPHPR
jgi:hypothetical protein